MRENNDDLSFMPDDLITDTEEASEPIILIVPPGVNPPQDFPLPIVKFVDNGQLVADVAKTLGTAKPTVIEIPGEFASIMISLARFLDAEIRALVGFEGDYPAYWNASTSVLPIAVTSELMAAREQSTAVGESGVQQSKKDKPLFKPVDDEAVTRRAQMLETSAKLDKLGSKEQSGE